MTKSVLSTICFVLLLLSITCQTAPNNTDIDSNAFTDANGTDVSQNNGTSVTNLPDNTTVASAGSQTNTSNAAVGDSTNTNSQTNASNADGTNSTNTDQFNSSDATGAASLTNTQSNNTNLNGSTTATNTTTTNEALPGNVTNTTTTSNSVTAPAGAAAAPNASTEALPLPVLEPTAAGNVTYPPISLGGLFLIEPQFLSNDVNNQVLAYLYCANNSATNVIMCSIYDGRDPTAARFLGIEYVINASAFDSLAPEEQRFWHSHAYGVQSGNIQIPNVNGTQLNDTLTVLAASFGKSIFLWNNLNQLPTGDPTPAFSFTDPGQINANVSTIYDNQTFSNVTQRTANNAGAIIPTLPIAADSWDYTGQIPVFNSSNVSLPANLWGLNFDGSP